MLILTNGLTDVADEGFLKVANSLVKRLKKRTEQNVYIVTYERKSSISDKHLKLNKLLLSKDLARTIRGRKDKVLYIPFPAKTLATALRTFILSFFAKGRLSVVWVQKSALNTFAKVLLRISRAKIIVFSKETAHYFLSFLDKRYVQYIKTGVDTEIFRPVSLNEAKQLKQKYGLNPEKPVVLHVGHLKSGRNIGELLKINENNQVVLVISTLFKSNQDVSLRKKLLDAPNVCLIDEFLPNIQEVYQLSDLYFFPVVEEGNCIDVPLSCLEAAACNKPIITTNYGEMSEFAGKKGFFFIDSFDENRLNELIAEGLLSADSSIRESVLEYDWNRAIEALL